ncbi:MAG: EAL domain-containing protein [Alphaproteobacteria bacterium]
MLATGLSPSPFARRPISLGVRASLCAVGLLAAMAAISTIAVLIGFESESRRHQEAGGNEVADRVARYSLTGLAAEDYSAVAADARRMASRSEVRRVSVRDQEGRLLAQAGGAGGSGEMRLASQALRAGVAQSARDPSDSLMLARPLRRGGHVLGVAVVTIKPDGFRYNAVLALTPFFLGLLSFLLIATPFIFVVVRRALRPLDELKKFAEKVAEQGEAAPIALNTRDEFEVLATAFNHMIGRLQNSMRKIQQIAFVDPVTQLPNQERFQREVDFFILQAEQQQTIGAVLVFEFQRLPRVMQILDHDAARDLTRAIADRFVAAARGVDRLVRLHQSAEKPATPARVGVHDFAVLAPNLASANDAARFAQHLNAALDQPFDWRGHKLSLGVVCGVALAPRDGRDADAVLRHARMALGAAHGAPARLKVFTPSLDRAATAHLTLEREMRAALENNEFRAYFQPKVDLATGRIEGAEALARWVRPDGALISPGKFIPAAEESGLIEPLSRAILREACWKAAAWMRAGLAAKVAVNVSALQFRNDRFADDVLNVIKNAGLPPHLLELEITETVAMEDPERALRVIEPLRAAGVGLAIDDFGCGHSSLAALSRLPFDVIKIDRQFVAPLDREDAQAAAIVEMILALANTLGLKVVAEGVERRAQAKFLTARGCQLGQGFLYSAAIPANDFAKLVRSQSVREDCVA